jgi:hypothetical protein
MFKNHFSIFFFLAKTLEKYCRDLYQLVFNLKQLKNQFKISKLAQIQNPSS